MQLHLTPPDAKEGKMDFGNLKESKEEAMKFFADFVRGQINLSRYNRRMRDRLISLADDAARRGII